MNKTIQPCLRRQNGVAVLAITVLLLLVATIGVLMVARVSLMEQKVVGADVRSKEVYSAAIGGLEYGLEWFEDNFDTIAWHDTDGDGNYCRGDTATPASLANTNLAVDDYAHNISYELRNCLTDSPVILSIISEAVAAGDSHVEKTVAVDVMLGTVSIFSPVVQGGEPSIFDSPPVLVERCVSNVTGNPDIYPNGGIAIGTTMGLDPDLDGSDDQTIDSCLDEGHFDLHDGSRVALDNPRSLWCTVFSCDATEQDLKAMEAREPERVLFVDDSYPHYPGQPNWNGNQWHNDLEDDDLKPYILYFDASVGCPKINGSTTVYGLVYYEEEDCGNQGWGGGKVYGTLAKSGDLTTFTANAEIHGEALDFGGGPEPGDNTISLSISEIERYSEIPGSWRDF